MRAFGGIALAVVCCLASQAAARPVGGRRLGVGLGFGKPTAAWGYLSLSDRLAIDAALGVASYDQHDLAAHGDLLVIFGGDATTQTAAGAYLGFGGFAIKFYDDIFAGLRLPFGLTLSIPEARLQLFGEVGLEVLLFRPYDTPREHELTASVGIRFFL